ncbi:YIP1 family protein [Patescibacteria group bacterium]|nr:YIP1 family protein [Patescibacteria group bacterium]MBU1703011.1 YIP1 family protein [Patescibacteria group bacterium]MBU1954043.1 YIP1 family protein [Patescibacteria group bacterium]
MKESSLKIPRIVLKDLDIESAFKSFLGIIKIDKKIIEKVAKDEKSGAAAALFLFIGVAVPWLFKAFFGIRVFNVVVRPDFSTVLISIIVGLVSVLIAMFFTTIFANRLFKGKGSFDEFFRVSGLASGLWVLAIVGSTMPMISTFVSLLLLVWGFVIFFVAIKTVFGIDDANTVLTILLTGVAVFVLGAIFSTMGLTAGQIGSVDFSSLSITF